MHRHKTRVMFTKIDAELPIPDLASTILLIRRAADRAAPSVTIATSNAKNNRVTECRT